MEFSVVKESTGLFARFRRKLDEVGWRYSLYLILLRFSPASIFQFRKFFITAICLGQEQAISPAGLRVREATEDDIELLSELGETEVALHRKFDNGHRVWVLESQGRFLACDWLLPSDKRIADWLILERNDGDIWSEVIFVDKEHRGQGLGPALRGHVVQHCRRLGFKRMLGMIDTLNRNSVRAMGKAGYRAIGYLRFIRILGVVFVHDGTNWRWGTWRKGQPLRIPVEKLAESLSQDNWISMQ